MRKEALEWWRGLREENKRTLAAKYKPNWSFGMVTLSTSTIESIYSQEKNPQS